MNQALFTHYEAAKNAGKKALAKELINRFIASFASDNQRIAWTRWYLEQGEIGHTIRHELFEAVIFPALLAGYREAEPWSIEMLARHIENLHRAYGLWAQIAYKNADDLYAELYRLAPESPTYRNYLLGRLVNWFRYCEHEWPSGILYGTDGATEAECEQLLRCIDEARTLDKENLYGEELQAFTEKVQQYRARRFP